MNNKIKIAISLSIYFLVILLLIGLIPLIQNDYLLAFIYSISIFIAAFLKRERGDLLFIVVGFIALFLSESFFILTGVETFNRTSLLGIMPVWLPFLWAFVFLVLKRSLWIVYSYINSDNLISGVRK